MHQGEEEERVDEVLQDRIDSLGSQLKDQLAAGCGEITARNIQRFSPYLSFDRVCKLDSNITPPPTTPGTVQKSYWTMKYLIGGQGCHNLASLRLDVRVPNMAAPDGYLIALTPYLPSAILNSMQLEVGGVKFPNCDRISSHMHSRYESKDPISDNIAMGNSPRYLEFSESIDDIEASMNLPFPSVRNCPLPLYAINGNSYATVNVILQPRNVIRVKRIVDDYELTTDEIASLEGISLSQPEISVDLVASYISVTGTEIDTRMQEIEDSMDEEDPKDRGLVYDFLSYITIDAGKSSSATCLVPVATRNSGTVRSAVVVSENLDFISKNKYFDFTNGNEQGVVRKVRTFQDGTMIRSDDYWSGVNPPLTPHQSNPEPHSGYFVIPFSIDPNTSCDSGENMSPKTKTILEITKRPNIPGQLYIVLQVNRQFRIFYDNKKTLRAELI